MMESEKKVLTFIWKSQGLTSQKQISWISHSLTLYTMSCSMGDWKHNIWTIVVRCIPGETNGVFMIQEGIIIWGGHDWSS